jgi:putative flippase GtrA
MKHLLKQIARRDSHPVIQFIKYGVAGGIATIVDVAMFFLLALFVIPAMTEDDSLLRLLDFVHQTAIGWLPSLVDAKWFYNLTHYDITPITQSVHERNFVINRCITFILSNSVAYIMNMLWVFTPGRHSRRKEIMLFFVVSTISLIIGTGMGWSLMHFLQFDTTQAFIGNIIASVMINFVCRKFLVFNG